MGDIEDTDENLDFERTDPELEGGRTVGPASAGDGPAIKGAARTAAPSLSAHAHGVVRR